VPRQPLTLSPSSGDFLARNGTFHPVKFEGQRLELALPRPCFHRALAETPSAQPSQRSALSVSSALPDLLGRFPAQELLRRRCQVRFFTPRGREFAALAPQRRLPPPSSSPFVFHFRFYPFPAETGAGSPRLAARRRYSAPAAALPSRIPLKKKPARR